MNLNATIFAQIIVFGILVWFTMKYVWPPIAKALDERADKIAEGLAAAERGKSDFEQAEKKVAELLADGRSQVAELVANAENVPLRSWKTLKAMLLLRLHGLQHKPRRMWSRKLTVRAKVCASRLLFWL